jgi:hypothetical protein
VGEDGFQRVGGSDERMYGPRAIALCGFPAAERKELLELLSRGRLKDAPVICIGDGQAEQTLSAVLAAPHACGVDDESSLTRAIVVSGLTESELQRFMAAYRSLGWARTLWAALTPTSETWTVRMLLAELAAEAEALGRR